MAKKSTKQASKKPGKPKLKPFDIHFFIEGGTSVWLQEYAESREAMGWWIRELLEEPGDWFKLDCRSGTMHLRRSRVLGFHLDDLSVDSIEPDTWRVGKRAFLLDDREVRLD